MTNQMFALYLDVYLHHPPVSVFGEGFNNIKILLNVLLQALRIYLSTEL